MKKQEHQLFNNQLPLFKLRLIKLKKILLQLDHQTMLQLLMIEKKVNLKIYLEILMHGLKILVLIMISLLVTIQNQDFLLNHKILLILLEKWVVLLHFGLKSNKFKKIFMLLKISINMLDLLLKDQKKMHQLKKKLPIQVMLILEIQDMLMVLDQLLVMLDKDMVQEMLVV